MDAEIDDSIDNLELEGPLFKAWSMSEHSHECVVTVRDFFPSKLYSPIPFTFIFFPKASASIFLFRCDCRRFPSGPAE